MKNKNKKNIKIGLFVVLLCLILPMGVQSVSAKTYKVSPKTVGKKVTNYRKYNQYTKGFYGINYYMQKMDKAGGGTLILKKGTYKISNTIFVPSNVTIILEDGVILKKIFKTGYSSLKASSSMFMLCPYSKKDKKNACKKYNSSKNVKIIGRGLATIDNSYCKTGASIICSHNKNITIKGIRFKNMKGGHFIEVNGVSKANISDNVFEKSYKGTKSKYYNKEAINIDCDDPTTGGLTVLWSKEDKTPCKNILIENNIFKGVTRGVGTHKYSQKNGKNFYHKNIIRCWGQKPHFSTLKNSYIL